MSVSKMGRNSDTPPPLQAAPHAIVCLEIWTRSATGQPKNYYWIMGLILVRFMVVLFLFCGLATAQKMPGFDAGAIDHNISPCVNFYQYACGGWLAGNPVPGDQSRWGRFDALQERNRTILQGILEAASGNKPTRSAVEQKIGDYYASCMDTKAIDQKGLAPIQPDLDRIKAMDGKPALTTVVTSLQRIGSFPFFRFSSEPDAKDSNEIIAGLDQGGIGLPDRDYYFRNDEKLGEDRKKKVH